MGGWIVSILSTSHLPLSPGPGGADCGGRKVSILSTSHLPLSQNGNGSKTSFYTVSILSTSHLPLSLIPDPDRERLKGFNPFHKSSASLTEKTESIARKRVCFNPFHKSSASLTVHECFCGLVIDRFQSFPQVICLSHQILRKYHRDFFGFQSFPQVICLSHRGCWNPKKLKHLQALFSKPCRHKGLNQSFPPPFHPNILESHWNFPFRTVSAKN